MADEIERVSIGEVNRNVQALSRDIKELVVYVRTQNGRVGLLETKVAVLEAVVPATGGASKTHIAAGGAAGATLTMLAEFLWKKLSGG